MSTEDVDIELGGDLYPQAGVIPYRFDDDDRLEILLIRKIGKRRWGIPKGLIGRNQNPSQAARDEAEEEAGVDGKMSEEPIGFYSFKKWGGICHVSVFLMNVTHVHDQYPEKERRQRQWFPLTTAAELAKKKRIRRMILELPKMIKNQCS